MSEAEVKKDVKAEKPTVKMNFWFIVFVVYLIASLAVMYTQHQNIQDLNTNVVTLQHEMEQNAAKSNSRTEKIIHQLENIVTEYKESLMEEPKEDEVANTPVLPEVTTGTYTGSATTEDTTTQMTLTLSEGNVASLTVVDASGDSSFSGTYTVVETTLVFTSDDNLRANTFTVNQDGSLTLVDNEVVLTLNK